MEYFEKVAAYEDDILYDLAEDEAYDLAYEKTAAAKWKSMMNSGTLSPETQKKLYLSRSSTGKFPQANQASLGFSTLNPAKNKDGIRYGQRAEISQDVRAGNFSAMKKAIADRNALNEKGMLGFANRPGALHPFMYKKAMEKEALFGFGNPKVKQHRQWMKNMISSNGDSISHGSLKTPAVDIQKRLREDERNRFFNNYAKDHKRIAY